MNGSVGDVVKVGGILCEVESEVEGEEGELAPVEAIPIPSPSTAPDSPISIQSELPSSTSHSVDELIKTFENKIVIATPSTRRLARESSVDLSQMEGTGKDGRVTKSDVMNYIETGETARLAGPSEVELIPATSESALRPTPSAGTQASPNIDASTSNMGSTTTIPLSGVRKAMFKAMTSTLSIPHFSFSESLDVTLLERMRKVLNSSIPLRHRKTLTPSGEAELMRLKEWNGEEGGDRIPEEMRYDRMTLLPLLIKALSIALESNPLFTCSLSHSTSDPPHLIRRSTHDISLALSPPSGGLYTPLLQSVHLSSPFQLASQITHLQYLSTISSPPKFPIQYKGNGTITLSNVGVIGGRFTSPIIPPTGQLAIGAMGRMRVVPMYVVSDVGEAKRIAVEGGGEQLKMEPRLIMVCLFRLICFYHCFFLLHFIDLVRWLRRTLPSVLITEL